MQLTHTAMKDMSLATFVIFRARVMRAFSLMVVILCGAWGLRGVWVPAAC
jgi:hypothetical protein